MKRAWLILIAALAVMLAYPTTMPSAKSPAISNGDTPTIYIISPRSGGDTPSQSGDDDDGDADDLGFKGGTISTTTNTERTRLMRDAAQVWWMYLVFNRLIL